MAHRLAGRGELRRLLAIRERRLLVVIRAALADLRPLVSRQDLRIAAAMGGQLPPVGAAIERRWQEHVEAMIAALVTPVPVRRAAPAPDPAEEQRRRREAQAVQDLARRQIGALIRELSPAQLQAVRVQLASLMELGPTPAVLGAIAHAAGLTSRQTQAVASFYRRALEQGSGPGAAMEAAQGYADRLLDLRARTIARHEAVDFTNQLVLERGRQVGAGGGRVTKQWVSARDGRVDGGLITGVCRQLDNNDRIPIDRPFVFEGQRYDGPPAHIGCRCLVEIWREDG